MKKFIILLLAFTSSLAFAKDNLVKCSVQTEKETSEIEISSNQRLSIKNENLLGTIQVIAGHLAQVMVEDTQTFIMTQEEPLAIQETGKGKAFIQDLKTGHFLIIKCMTQSLTKI